VSDEQARPATSGGGEASLGPTAPHFHSAGDAVGGRRHRLSRGDGLTILALLVIMAVAAHLRFLGVDWDAGQHLHPDERFLTMVASALQTPEDFGHYLDSQTSTLNPRNQGHEFYVYGTWPMTLVYLTADRLRRTDFPRLEVGNRLQAGADRLEADVDAWFLQFGTDYARVYLVGRKLMAVFDLMAILLLYVLGVRLYDRRVGLLAAALAAVTAFSIQQSHFFTVDTAVSFFVLLFFVAAVGMVRHGGWEDIVFAGLALGMALASKISVWPLVGLAVLALILADRRRGRHLAREWPRLTIEVVLLGIVAFATLRVTQPDMWAGPGWADVAANPEQHAHVTSRAPSWWHTVDALMPEELKPLLLPEPRWAGEHAAHPRHGLRARAGLAAESPVVGAHGVVVSVEEHRPLGHGRPPGSRRLVGLGGGRMATRSRAEAAPLALALGDRVVRLPGNAMVQDDEELPAHLPPPHTPGGLGPGEPLRLGAPSV